MKNSKFLLKLAIALIITSIVCYTSTAVILINNNFNFNFSNVDFSNNDFEIFHGKHIYEDKEFNIDDIDNISLDATSGNVEVISSNDDTIKLQISGYVDNNIFSNASIDIYIDSNKTLKYKLDDTSNVNLSKVKITLSLPKDYKKNLDINVHSANVNINNSDLSNATIQSRSGDITCSDSNLTSLVIQSTSGTVKLNNISATSITCQSTSGNIDFKSIDGELNFNTNSAHIKGSITSLGKNNSFSTSSGDLRLDFSSDCSFEFAANTNSGDIDNNLKLDNYTSNKKEANGIYKDATNSIKCSTKSGDIEINSL